VTKISRDIIKIDEEKCDGCGLCVPACKEGAIQIIDGKAKLVSEIYCDGLGACLGECPQDAITIEKRVAQDFDEEATQQHLKKMKAKEKAAIPPLACGCPGTMARTIKKESTTTTRHGDQQSELRQWPIQLTLVPVTAPYLMNADLVILADCTAVAYANLHRDFLKDKVIVMACPKLDEVEPYIEKLARMFDHNNFKSIEVVMMEVPCCRGLGQIADVAAKNANKSVKIKKTIVGIDGNKLL
jgi:ferredoxin